MGPLAGIKVIELKGIGPGPYAGMLLADMGAEVIVVERSRQPNGIASASDKDVNSRGKKSIALNLKHKDGVETLLKLVESADMLIEGFRPGVTERLGFGPDVCHTRNPGLIFGRITGWGQSGPLAKVAGHDINYISIAGALGSIGTQDKPVPPLNLVGDYAGGSLFLVMGMLAALNERNQSGKGQVIDAAITDGTANLMSVFYSLYNMGQWTPERESNLLDGGAHFYNTYETSDGKFISLGPIEPQFYQLLIEKSGMDPRQFTPQNDTDNWPEMKKGFETIFKTKTRDQWCELLEGSDSCFAPVLDFVEAPRHPHNIARSTFIEIDGNIQPGTAPRFSRSECAMPNAPKAEGVDTESVLKAAGLSDQDIQQLVSSGAVPA
ncbi:CaiB/BaiF CoA transferase family protein [Oceanicoccus sagamiensis]|uniref:Carnitine dehydratase n=1 Tax=Oceanicoccus sagamiensis TaxID=716816 RepID=A0A1X9NI18_9GAMM|nr:CaiB/BaiF CoA-transferase family protein [Oceanicoccus sagamiensis]ARN75485.1 carnitine dehydratase [Oceanicoccus sagamiensis]